MVLLRRKLQLDLEKKYTLEEIYRLSSIVLNRMCWRFDVSGWVGDVPSLLKKAIYDVPRFTELYHTLSSEQQLMISFVCEDAGYPIPMDRIYQYFADKMPEEAIARIADSLVQDGWLLEGESPHCLLAMPDFKILLKAIPAFERFLKAELPPEQEPIGEQGQFFADLIELAAFLYAEKPKLTGKSFLPKNTLRRLVAKLSAAATDGWEEFANESLYTDKMLALLKGLQAFRVLRIADEGVANYYYDFNVEQWENFVFSSLPQRLLQAISWEFSRMNERRRGCLSFVANLLKVAAQTERRWQTSASLMMKSTAGESLIVFVQRDPVRSEEWLQRVVLEPMSYLGVFEKTAQMVETPWLQESQTMRNFWRLTPVGIALAEWLVVQENKDEAMNQLSKIDIANQEAVSQFTVLIANWQQILPGEIEQQLIIQPDFSFFVPRYAPPYLLWVLSIFAAAQLQDYMYQGKFSRDSVLRALKGGISASELFDMIEDHCPVPPADNVIYSLREWCAAYDRVIFATVAVLACDTPEIAEEILIQSKLAAYIVGQISPKILLIKPEGEGIIRKWLEKKNWVPRPKRVTGDALYKWLQK